MPLTRTRRALLAAPLPLAGCPGPAPAPPSPLPAGWTCLATPSAFNGAGSVFYVDPNQAKFTYRDYAAATPGLVSAPGPTPDVTAAQTTTLSIGLLASILGVSPKAGVNASDTASVSFGYKNASELNVPQAGADQVLADFATRTDVSPQNRYYFVRGAIIATDVTYTFNKDLSGSLSTTVPIHAVDVSGSASGGATTAYTTTAHFAAPVTVCIEPQQILTANVLPRPGVAHHAVRGQTAPPPPPPAPTPPRALLAPAPTDQPLFTKTVN